MALGFVYLQYWLNLAIVKGSFFLHLSVIKSTFGIVHRIAKGIMFLPLLDSHMLDVQPSFCKLIMAHNARQ
jgi:E3 ubiquitin-protein ligase DOA10